MQDIATATVGSQSTVKELNNDQINWDDFNYPICLRIYHYNSQETPELHRRKVSLLRVNHTLIIISTILNIVANIVGAAQRVPGGGSRVEMSVFVFLFWIPLSFQFMFLPYHIIMKGEGKPVLFYVLSFLVFAWFLIWSIADFADANGFVMAAKNFNAGRTAAGALGIINSISSLLVAILTAVCTFLFFNR